MAIYIILLIMEKEEILKIISCNIRTERLKRRLSQEKLSELSGITQKYLNMIENAKVNPSIVVVVKICRSLNVNIDSLLKNSEN